MIWLVFATMTAGVVLALVWPLARGGTGVDARQADIDFYTSQLAEMGEDVGRGSVNAAEAEATRIEIARRLLASARAPDRVAGRTRRGPRLAAVIIAVAFVPAASLGLYLRLGSPGAPDAPLAARTDTKAIDVATAMARIEAHLAIHPEDGRGFSLIAPVYLRLGRYDDAARAFGEALRLLGEDAGRRAALGQALVMAADGVVTVDARAAFDKALADDPTLPEARFFKALAAEQDGDKPRALEAWRALAADSPQDAPWRASVEGHIAALSGAPAPAPRTGPDSAAGAMIAALPAAEQQAAIRGMVEGLAARLARNGRDCDGWLRLIRAYKVLGDEDKARNALLEARKGLSDDAGSLARLASLGRELGLES